MTELDLLAAAGAAAVTMAMLLPIGAAVRRRIAEPLRLCCIAGPLCGREELLTQTLLIGRGAECLLALAEPAVSRRHAAVVPGRGCAHVRDLGSAAGIWSEGRRLFDEPLGAGEQFQIGANVFVVLEAGQAPPALREHLCGSPMDEASFDIEGVLHTGCTFSIMLARRHGELDDDRCVVKYLHDRSSESRVRLARYLEIALARTAFLPALVRVRGGSSSAPQPYIVEDYVCGVPLRTRMADGLSEREARDVFGRLCDALESLHAAGFAHGKLNAGDLLLMNDGTVRILNAGWAASSPMAAAEVEEDIAALIAVGARLLGANAAKIRMRDVHAVRKHWNLPRRGFTAKAAEMVSGFPPLRLAVRDTGRVVLVESNPFTLGRLLNPADRRLSRRHGELRFHDNMWTLRSCDGNIVRRNGDLIAVECVVGSGDELHLGDTKLDVRG